ncbi:MAG: shikimate kinase AroK [Gammaproteobacteria bacterium]|nr:shikimate kinase AroK [Gammaproteobacteria bacterium]
MDIPRSIFLVGLMAVGKTTIGRLLAQSLGMQFLDSDHEIENRAGADTSWIFEREGEAGFRDREEAVIDDLTQRTNVVLATGGGAVLRAANRRLLAERGVVIHLDSPVDRIVERTAKDRKRPLLQNGDPRETLTNLMRMRGPLYEEIRHYRFVTDRQSPKALTRNIEETLRRDGLIL